MKILILSMLAIFAAGGRVTVSAQTKKPDDKAAAEIKAVLNSTADGWNAGDLSKYLAAYVPEATEMTGEGPRGGVEYIEKTMRAGFWKTVRPLQVLRYENVVVR